MPSRHPIEVGAKHELRGPGLAEASKEKNIGNEELEGGRKAHGVEVARMVRESVLEGGIGAAVAAMSSVSGTAGED